MWYQSILKRAISKFSLHLYPYTLRYLLSKPLGDDSSECQMQTENSPYVVEQLRYILQTPEDAKGFVNFAVEVEGLNLTNCRPGLRSIATCQLLIVNPMASFKTQV